MSTFEESTPDAGELPPLDLTPRSQPDGSGTPGPSGVGRDRSRRGRMYVAGIIAVLVVAGVLVVRSLGGATLYFYEADEAVAQRSELGDRRFRLFGNVESGSVVRTGEGATFRVRQDDAVVDVQHAGDPPQLFQPGIPVVLEGHWSDDRSVFQSDRMLVKHTEEYVEKNPDRKSAADSRP